MIKLSDNSLWVLKECLKKRKPSLLAIVEDSSQCEYGMDFYNELRQIVDDELIEEGFNQNYEPNEYGLTLERLIDDIGRLFM